MTRPTPGLDLTPSRWPARALRPLWRTVKSRFARPHPRPVLILGNQKSGTTAIAGLLAAATDLPVTLDTPGIHGDVQKDLHDGVLDFADFLRRNRLDFSRPIVKEPALTFLYPELRVHFPSARWVFVVRDPRQNVRSILDRLGIPGDLTEVTEDHLALAGTAGPNWRRMLEGWLGATGDNYVARLASRWCVAADVYLGAPEAFRLVSYENFVKDKVGAIEALARDLGLPVRASFHHLVDTQFQPKGDRQVTLERFFGPANLARIERLCGERMHRLHYSI